MWKLIVFFSLIFSTESFPAPDLNSKVLDEYLKIQKQYSNEFCSPNVEKEFEERLRRYKGDGNFIPIDIDEKLDSKTIKMHLGLFAEKDAWIKNQLSFLSKMRDFKNEKSEIVKIERELDDLIRQNQKYFFERDKDRKEKLKEELKDNFNKLKLSLDEFKNKIPFLLSFKFPLDHLELRREYERNKSISNKDARVKANSVYFFRKIVQDGLFDEDFLRNDLVVRAAFDTLYLSLKKSTGRIMLTDNERVDLLFILNTFERYLDLSPEKIASRFKEWESRNHRSEEFYQALLDKKKIKIKDNVEFKTITSLLEEKAKALYILKEYILSKEARVYEYWSRQSDLNQALFVIETILYNEVGKLDSPDALERKDVAQIVINRMGKYEFNQLNENDSIRKYISGHANTKANKWLNILFKEGEFSFTYFYIPSNFQIYCPDMSKTGAYLRRENVRLALELLNHPRKNFNALRYYSRMSMHGRIEMDNLWTDYRLISERPGNRVKNPRKIYESIKKGNFKFLYIFTNEELKKNFLVVEIKGRNYVVEEGNNKEIFYYRNPHQFKYFSPIK